jgi:RNA polymerase sigma factor (TIGR02999 family)
MLSGRVISRKDLIANKRVVGRPQDIVVSSSLVESEQREAQRGAEPELKMNNVPNILSAIERGDARAAGQLLPLVYEELRRLAAAKLAREASNETLQATDLVHEAYLRLVGSEPDQPWDGRGHFFAAAAEAMRRILVDRARRRKSLKRGGGRHQITLDLAGLASPGPDPDLLALDEALDRLAERDPVKAELVKLLYFAGLTLPQAALALGLSHATAKRLWTYARAWLRVEIRGGGTAPQKDEPES